jgi:hypothetical protein
MSCRALHLAPKRCRASTFPRPCTTDPDDPQVKFRQNQILHTAALRLQRNFRGHLARKQITRMRYRQVVRPDRIRRNFLCFVGWAIPGFRNFPGILGSFSEFWVLFGNCTCFFAFQAFVSATFGIYLDMYRTISGNYRQNAREFGIEITGNSKGKFVQAL